MDIYETRRTSKKREKKQGNEARGTLNQDLQVSTLRTSRTPPRQIGQLAPTNIGAHSPHSAKWKQSRTMWSRFCSAHSTHRSLLTGGTLVVSLEEAETEEPEIGEAAREDEEEEEETAGLDGFEEGLLRTDERAGGFNMDIYTSEITELLASGNNSNNIPNDFVLNQNYPNPFNPSTVISFGLPSASEVTIEIYSTMGQLVKTIAKGTYPAGNHSVKFNAGSLSSGVYLYKINAGNFTETKRMVLVK